MKFWVTYPLVAHPHNPEFLTKSALTRFCVAAEGAGFEGIGFTDHPAPTERWLQAGGHDAVDPFTALSFCAAVTDRLRLIPNILVLPYRNPFLVAKAAATLDAFSGGRFTLAVATGYMRGEYRALGVDFDRRNALFDEAIEVISEAARELYQDPKWNPLIVERPEVLGVESLSHAGVTIRVWIVTLPLQQYLVGREFNRRVYLALQEHGIRIGMPQQIVRAEVPAAEAASQRSVSSIDQTSREPSL